MSGTEKNATSLVELKASWRLKCVLRVFFALLLLLTQICSLRLSNEKKMYSNARGL